MNKDVLFYTALIPLIGILVLLFINSEQKKSLKIIALNFSCLPFLAFLFVRGGFKKSVGTSQSVAKTLWIPALNITLGIDGISLFFLLLTTLLVSLCILINWNTIHSNLKKHLICFLLLQFLSMYF
jgi:NADH:ubiquinone oxidoreductase subunit 4 (subunit M)